MSVKKIADKSGKLRWRADFDGPPAPDGKRTQHRFWCPAKTKAEAEAYEAERKDEIFSKRPAAAKCLTLGDYIREWLDEAEKRLSPTTHNSYGKNARNHIYPRLGNIELLELRPIDVQKFLEFLAEKGNKQTGSSLSPKTIHNIHGLLSSCLSDAYRLDTIPINPMDKVKAPRVPKREIKVASLEDIAKTLKAIEGWKYRIPVLVVMYIGVRSGEALALQWADIDFETGYITVRHNLIQVPGRVELKATKSENVRLVKMDIDLQEILSVEHERQQSEGIETPWVGCNEDGECLTPGGINRAFGRLAKEHGIHIRVHGYRHTQATALMEADIPTTIVAARLGHATTAFTQDKYQHARPSMQDPSVAAIHKMMEAAKRFNSEADTASETE